MPRAGLSRETVVRIALDLVDAGGPSGFADLSLAKVAAHAGVATPSLYKHVPSLADLRRAVSIASVEDVTRATTEATVGRSGADAVVSLAHAVRDLARAHPGRWAAAQAAPDPDDPADDALTDAADRSVRTFAAVLRGFDLPDDRTIDAVRSIRASLHGFVTLELTGGYRLPHDLDASFTTHVTMMLAGLTALRDA